MLFFAEKGEMSVVTVSIFPKPTDSIYMPKPTLNHHELSQAVVPLISTLSIIRRRFKNRNNENLKNIISIYFNMYQAFLSFQDYMYFIR